VIAEDQLHTLDPEQLHQALRAVRAEMAFKDELLAQREQEVAFKQAPIDKPTHENAALKRLKFAAKSESYTAEQKSLLEETLDMDLAALAAEIEALQPGNKPAEDKKLPKRQPLPPHLDAQISRSCSADTTKLLLPAVDSTPQGRAVAARTTKRSSESSHSDSTSQAITPGAGSDLMSISVALTTGSFSTKRCLCPIASIKRHSTKVRYPPSSTTWEISTAMAFIGRHFSVPEVIVERPVLAAFCPSAFSRSRWT